MLKLKMPVPGFWTSILQVLFTKFQHLIVFVALQQLPELVVQTRGLR